MGRNLRNERAGEAARSLNARFGESFDFTSDAALDALDPAAVEWVRDRVDEFHAALMACPGAVTYDPGEIEFERDLERAAERWAAAWNTQPAATPFFTSLHNGFIASFGASAWPSSPRRPYAALDTGVSALQLSTRWPSWEYSNSTWALAHHHAIAGLVGAEVLWRMASEGVREGLPSPWAPLLALWERGVCPLVLPDGSLLLFVRVVGSPQSLSSRKPKPALSTEPPPVLGALGLVGLPAGWFTPLPSPPMPKAVRGLPMFVTPEIYSDYVPDVFGPAVTPTKKNFKKYNKP